VTRYYRAPTGGRPCPLSRGRRYMLATGQTCSVDIFDFFPDISLPLSLSAFSHRSRQVQLIVAATSIWLHNIYIIYIHIYYRDDRLLRYTFYINEIWKKTTKYRHPARDFLIKDRFRELCAFVGLLKWNWSIPACAVFRDQTSPPQRLEARVISGSPLVPTYTLLYLSVCLPAYIIQWKYKPTVPNLLHSSIYRS